MRLHDKQDKLHITDYLKFGYSSAMRFIKPDKSEVRVKMRDVAEMFTDYRNTPGRVRVFDDFNADRIALTTIDNGLWIGFAGTDANATIGVIVASPEGTITMGSGNATGSEDGSVLSRILLTMGALVSIGTQVFECKIALDQLTGVTLWVGLADKLCTDNEHPIHLVNSGTVADGGLTVSNVAGFAFSSDATATTKWQLTSENAGTLGGKAGVAAAEDASTEGPTADIYDTLRIEINKSGDIAYFINGGLVSTRAAAIATNAVLIPYLSMDAAVDAQTDTVMTIDSILHEFDRTTTNA